MNRTNLLTRLKACSVLASSTTRFTTFLGASHAQVSRFSHSFAGDPHRLYRATSRISNMADTCCADDALARPQELGTDRRFGLSPSDFSRSRNHRDKRRTVGSGPQR